MARVLMRQQIRDLDDTFAAELSDRRSIVGRLLEVDYDQLDLADADSCLSRLQEAVDRLAADNTVELQSLGILLGDLIATRCQLDWVVVQDNYGADPALRNGATSQLLFPLTMLSKRVERGEPVRVAQLFEMMTTDTERFQNRPWWKFW